MSGEIYHKASGTKSFLDLIRHPGGIIGRGSGSASVDFDELCRGVPIVVAAFFRQQGPFKQGRLVVRASSEPPMKWERYRLLRGYKPAKSLYPPYEIGYARPVEGPGAWNVDGLVFAAVSLTSGAEEAELAVPVNDIDFMRSALSWLNSDRSAPPS